MDYEGQKELQAHVISQSLYNSHALHNHLIHITAGTCGMWLDFKAF